MPTLQQQRAEVIRDLRSQNYSEAHARYMALLQFPDPQPARQPKNGRARGKKTKQPAS